MLSLINFSNVTFTNNYVFDKKVGRRPLQSILYTHHHGSSLMCCEFAITIILLLDILVFNTYMLNRLETYKSFKHVPWTSNVQIKTCNIAMCQTAENLSQSSTSLSTVKPYRYQKKPRNA